MFEQRPELRVSAANPHIGDAMFELEIPVPSALDLRIWTLDRRVAALTLQVAGLEARLAYLEIPWWRRAWMRLASWSSARWKEWRE